MVNKNNFIFLFILIFMNYMYGQKYNGYVIYKKIKNDNTSIEKIKNLKIRMFIEETEEEIKKLEYKLKFNSLESSFKVIKKMDIENNRIIQFAISTGEGGGTKYTNLKSRQSINQKEAYGKKFLIFSSLDSIKWQLNDKSKIINGYTCYKALSTKTVIGSKEISLVDVTAWYAPKIPVNFGPIGFAGLPGLIIELQFDKYKYYMTELELNPKQIIKIKKPIKGEKMTLNEFLEYEKKLAGQSRGFMRN